VCLIPRKLERIESYVSSARFPNVKRSKAPRTFLTRATRVRFIEILVNLPLALIFYIVLARYSIKCFYTSLRSYKNVLVTDEGSLIPTRVQVPSKLSVRSASESKFDSAVVRTLDSPLPRRLVSRPLFRVRIHPAAWNPPGILYAIYFSQKAPT